MMTNSKYLLINFNKYDERTEVWPLIVKTSNFNDYLEIHIKNQIDQEPNLSIQNQSSPKNKLNTIRQRLINDQNFINHHETIFYRDNYDEISSRLRNSAYYFDKNQLTLAQLIIYHILRGNIKISTDQINFLSNDYSFLINHYQKPLDQQLLIALKEDDDQIFQILVYGCWFNPFSVLSKCLNLGAFKIFKYCQSLINIDIDHQFKSDQLINRGSKVSNNFYRQHIDPLMNEVFNCYKNRGLEYNFLKTILDDYYRYDFFLFESLIETFLYLDDLILFNDYRNYFNYYLRSQNEISKELVTKFYFSLLSYGSVKILKKLFEEEFYRKQFITSIPIFIKNYLKEETNFPDVLISEIEAQIMIERQVELLKVISDFNLPKFETLFLTTLIVSILIFFYYKKQGFPGDDKDYGNYQIWINNFLTTLSIQKINYIICYSTHPEGYLYNFLHNCLSIMGKELKPDKKARSLFESFYIGLNLYLEDNMTVGEPVTNFEEIKFYRYITFSNINKKRKKR